MNPLPGRRVLRGLACLLFSITFLARPAVGATITLPCPVTPAMLNQAVLNANATVPVADTIQITGGPCTITYTAIGGPGSAGSDNALPLITSNLTINGNGSTIARSTAAGTPNFRLLAVRGVSLTLRNLTITGGNLIGNNPGGGVTAINGTLNLDNVMVYGNSTTANGGGVVAQATTVSIDHSTFYANSATNAGGLHLIAGSSTIRRSTFILNQAAGSTGAMILQGNNALVESVTVASNSAGDGIGGVMVNNFGTSPGAATLRSMTFADNGRLGDTAPGGAIFTCVSDLAGFCGSGAAPVVHVGNSIITDTDSTAPEVVKPCSADAGGRILDDGGNIEYPTNTCAGAHADPMIAVPPAGTPISSDWVYRLLPGSPAIDLGRPVGCASTDQRGAARPDGAACDAGAYEAHLPDTSAQGPAGPSEAPSVSFTSPGASNATFECSVDASSFVACTSPYTPAGLSLGPHAIAVRASVDGFTDTTPAVVDVIVVDTTAPLVDCTVPAAGGWRTGDVVVACTASDGSGSGLANAGDSTFTLSTSGEGTALSTASRTVTDNAGNETTVGPFGSYDVDKTVPTVTCAAPSTGSWKTADVTVTCTAGDGGSGLANPADASFTLSTSGEGNALSTTTVTISDAAGNSVPAGPFGPFMVDKTAPAFTCSAPPAGSWNQADVSVTCTASDATSGLADAADASFTLSTTGEGSALETASRTITDAAGNSATAGPFGPYKVDKSAPSISCSPSPAGVWSKTDVSVTCTATDGGSGLADAANASFTLNTTGEGNALSTASRVVTDAAGNSATAGPFGPYMVDKTAPAFSCNAPAAGGWNKTGVPVNCTATDGGSGISAADASFTLTTSGEGAAIVTSSRTITDAAGNSVTAGPFGPFKVDLTAPSVTCSAAATGVWSKAVVSITCTGSDSGSGLAPADQSFTLSTTGEGSALTIAGRTVTDAAGNSTTVGPFGPFMVDTTAPSVVCSAPPAGPWSRTDVSVACTATDGGSGIQPANASFVLTTSGEGAALSTPARSVSDAAGNVTTVGPFGPYKVDKTAPSITAPAAKSATATGAAGAVISDATLGSASASDASGPPTVSRSGVPAGNQFPVGTTTVTYTATDAAGNTKTATQVVTVTAAPTSQPYIDEFIRIINASRFDSQTKALLVNYVRQLPVRIQGLTASQRSAAIARISVIIVLVQHAPSQALPPAEARRLIDALNALAAAIRAGSGGGGSD